MYMTLRKYFFFYMFLVLFCYSIVVALLTSQAIQHIKTDAANRCKTVAGLTARLLRSNYLYDFQRMATLDIQQPGFQEAHHRVHEFMLTMKGAYKNLTFLYTFKYGKGDQTIVYLVDSEPPESPDFVGLGVTEQTMYPPFKAYHKNNFMSMASDTLQHDPKWGWFISGFAPITNGTEIIGHVGADVSEELLDNDLASTLTFYLFIGCLGGIVLIAMAWMIYIAYHKTQTDNMKKMCDLHRVSVSKFVDDMDFSSPTNNRNSED